MQARSRFLRGFTAGLVIPATGILAPVALGSETTIYTYDALGRLVISTRSGGPNNGMAVGTCFDRAGNRTRYDVVTPAPAPTPTPTPCPTPP